MYCYFFVLFSFTFGGKIPHPPFVLLFLSIYSRVVSYKKKNNNASSFSSSSKMNLGMFLLLVDYY